VLQYTSSSPTTQLFASIAPNDVIPLETLRIGLRGDTFFTFLPKELNKTIEK
jgi:phosphosulfolactate synthase